MNIKHIYTPILLIMSIAVAQAQTVSTFAGSGYKGSTDGIGTAASFNCPYGVAVDTYGNVYVADAYNYKIRKITPAGVVSTFAGSGNRGSADGKGTEASFYNPRGIAVDALGNVYVADTENLKIRKINSAGVVSTLAGNGSGYKDGAGNIASFDAPYSVAVDDSGNIYVADLYNNKIRKITTAGVVSTFAGSGISGQADGTGKAASFSAPTGVAVDTYRNVYVADYGNNKIRKITPAGVVSTFAGSGNRGSADGIATVARFNNPSGLAIDALGNLYVAEEGPPSSVSSLTMFK